MPVDPGRFLYHALGPRLDEIEGTTGQVETTAPQADQMVDPVSTSNGGFQPPFAPPVVEMDESGKVVELRCSYDPATRERQRDPEIETLIIDHSKTKGIARRPIPPAEVVERLMYALINEGAWILEEGIAQRGLHRVGRHEHAAEGVVAAGGA